MKQACSGSSITSIANGLRSGAASSRRAFAAAAICVSVSLSERTSNAHALVANDGGDDVAVAVMALDDVEDLVQPQHLLNDRLERLAGDPQAVVGRFDGNVLRPDLDQVCFQGAIVFQIALRLPLFHFVERRLGDVDVPVLDQLLELAIHERQQECADVGTIDVGIRHDDDRVVAQLRDIAIFRLANAGPERRDQQANSCEESILSKRAFSTFRILPRKGRIA